MGLVLLIAHSLIETLQLQPSQAPVAGNTIVTVVGTNFPSEYSYECRFRQLGSMSSSGYYTNENKYVTVPAIYNDSTILLCPTPSWDNQGASFLFTTNWTDTEFMLE